MGEKGQGKGTGQDVRNPKAEPRWKAKGMREFCKRNKATSNDEKDETLPKTKRSRCMLGAMPGKASRKSRMLAPLCFTQGMHKGALVCKGRARRHWAHIWRLSGLTSGSKASISRSLSSAVRRARCVWGERIGENREARSAERQKVRDLTGK